MSVGGFMIGSRSVTYCSTVGNLRLGSFHHLEEDVPHAGAIQVFEHLNISTAPSPTIVFHAVTPEINNGGTAGKSIAAFDVDTVSLWWCALMGVHCIKCGSCRIGNVASFATAATDSGWVQSE